MQTLCIVHGRQARHVNTTEWFFLVCCCCTLHICKQIRSYSPRAASEPEPCSPTPPQFHVTPSGFVSDRRVPYSDGECSLAHGRTGSPPPPAPPGMTETMMDRAMQSSLPSLADEQLSAIDARRSVVIID